MKAQKVSSHHITFFAPLNDEQTAEIISDLSSPEIGNLEISHGYTKVSFMMNTTPSRIPAIIAEIRKSVPGASRPEAYPVRGE